MQEWWLNLTGAQQFLWGLALFFSLLFLFQIIAAFIGFGEGSEATEADLSYDSAPSMFFTLRNAIVFFLGFSWGGLASIEAEISIFWAVLIGFLMVAINLFLLRGLASFNETGNLNLNNAIGKQAIVSIQIPAKLTGSGKVNITIQDRLEELEAMTEEEAIPRGQPVKVLRISNYQLIVIHSKD